MAKTPRFIQFSELSESLRDFIQAGAKIFPIETYEDLPLIKDKEYYRIMSGTHKNEIYAWVEASSEYQLIGADDRDIRWVDVKEKPNVFPAETHTHTRANITDFPTTMPPSAHTHTEAEITNLDKYTQAEVDTAITNMGNTKANSVHTHTEAGITDLDKYTKSEVDGFITSLNNNKAPTSHTHTKTNITDFAHEHPISEVTNLKTTLDEKVDKVAGKVLSTNDFTDDDKSKLDALQSDATFDYTAMSEELDTHKTSSDHDNRYNTRTEITNALAAKAESSTVNGHIGNSTIHVTQLNKDIWDAKWDYSESAIQGVKVNNAGNADTVNNLTVQTAVPTGAKFTDTVYTHPSTHPASMITDLPAGKKVARFVVGTSTAGWTSKDVDYLCDGTADDVEINAAIQTLPATGGEIIILDGTYNITEKIDVNKNNVSIVGNGNATILKRMYNHLVPEKLEGVITLTEVSGCTVEKLYIDGNKANYTSGINLGIYLDSSSNNNITSNTCNNDLLGIYINSSSSNTITGNNFNNNNENGINLNSSSSNTIASNNCNNNDSGIIIYSSSNNTITGNNFNNNDSGIIIYSSSNNTITGNTCIRGTGLTTDYTESQHTIQLTGTDNSYNLISNNNCMGKAVTVGGGMGNTIIDNKWSDSSGRILESYSEKLTTVTAGGGSIDLSLGNVFVHTPSGNRTYSITNAVNGQAHSFTLIINMGATVRTLTFPASVKWQGGEIPNMSTASKTYILTFMSVDGGTTWLGMFGGEF